MKKLLSLILALTLCLIPLVALADEESSIETSSETVSVETSSVETSSETSSVETSSETSSLDQTSSSTSSTETSSTISDEVVFSGNFEPLKLIVGRGSDADILKGITAKDASSQADLTSQIIYVGTVKFDKVGDYPIIYRVKDKTGVATRIIKIVQDSTTEDLVHQKIDDGRNYLQDIDFESVKGTNRNLIYNIYIDSNYRTLKYSWRFVGSDIKGEYPTKMSVTIYGEENCANTEAIKKAVGKVTYKILSFECGARTLPAKAQITMLVEDKFTSADSLYLYQYTDGKLVLVADSLQVNGAGYLTYSFSKGGDYVLTDKKAGYQDTSSEATSSKPVSSTPTSSTPASSDVTSSEISTSSDVTSSDTSTVVSNPYESTSSQDVPANAPEVTTVLLVIVLSAIGLMLVTVIAFATVRRNSR